VNLEQLTNLARFELTSLGLGSIALDSIIQLKLNSAYMLFVGLTGEIDDTVDLEGLAPGSPVEIPRYVRKVKRVLLAGDELRIVNSADLNYPQALPNSPSVFVLGDRFDHAFVLKAPTEPYNLTMHVRRGVKSVMSEATDTPSDINEEYHPALVDKVLADMLRVQPGDMNRVAYIRDRDASFANAVDNMRRALERVRSKNSRLVAYGGI
jgi:hypothetical protein